MCVSVRVCCVKPKSLLFCVPANKRHTLIDSDRIQQKSTKSTEQTKSVLIITIISEADQSHSHNNNETISGVHTETEKHY